MNSDLNIKVGLESIRNLVENLGNHVDHLILLSYPGFTRNSIDYTASFSIRIETFKASFFFFSIVKHYLVPTHRCLSESEVKHLKNLGYVENKMSSISVRDPVVQYYGLTVGCIIKIQRNLGNMEMEIVFRRVKKM